MGDKQVAVMLRHQDTEKQRSALGDFCQTLDIISANPSCLLPLRWLTTCTYSDSPNGAPAGGQLSRCRAPEFTNLKNLISKISKYDGLFSPSYKPWRVFDASQILIPLFRSEAWKGGNRYIWTTLPNDVPAVRLECIMVGLECLNPSCCSKRCGFVMFGMFCFQPPLRFLRNLAARFSRQNSAQRRNV